MNIATLKLKLQKEHMSQISLSLSLESKSNQFQIRCSGNNLMCMCGYVEYIGCSS